MAELKHGSTDRECELFQSFKNSTGGSIPVLTEVAAG